MRVRVARGGGVGCSVTAVGEHRGVCRYNKGARRLAARGIRRWTDVTHEEGRWLSVGELRMKGISLKGEADVQVYRGIDR